jgi:hypothetical protein
VSLIAPISGASSVFLPLSQPRGIKQSYDPLAAVPPFWRQLHERIASAGSDRNKFALLTQLAADVRHTPPPGEYLPPEIALALHEEEVTDWARDRMPGVRGRLYRLMRGANVTGPWPYTLLQNEGRFDPLWCKQMMEAAARYIKALRSDPQAVALLQQDLYALPRATQQFLVTRMAMHAADALGIPVPEIRMLDPLRNQQESGKFADTVFETPIKIRFYPAAFSKGAVNLVVTVFHEMLHAAQMNLILAARPAAAGLGPHCLDPNQSGRAAILELSMAHLHAIEGQRHSDYHYYLYRYATEVEREAYLAELEVAILAANCPEFNPGRCGTLSSIRAASGLNQDGAEYDPNARVISYIRTETGFDPAELSESAAKVLNGCQNGVPTLHALAALQQRRPPQTVWRRATERSSFDATAHRLGRRHFPLPSNPACNPIDQPAQVVGVLHATGRTVGRSPKGPDALDTLWSGLLKLEQLRDPLDTSDLIAHALLSSAPKLFYGQSNETQFLRSTLIATLDASRPPLVQVVRQHLAQRFGCKLVRHPSRSQFDAIVSALRHAWYAYRSALSRKIIFEVAASELGFFATADTPHDHWKMGRDALRRAILGATDSHPASGSTISPK